MSFNVELTFCLCLRLYQCDKQVIEALASDNDMVEVKNDSISQLLTKLSKLRRKSFQLYWDNKVFHIDSTFIPLYTTLSYTLEVVEEPPWQTFH